MRKKKTVYSVCLMTQASLNTPINICSLNILSFIFTFDITQRYIAVSKPDELYSFKTKRRCLPESTGDLVRHIGHAVMN